MKRIVFLLAYQIILVIGGSYIIDELNLNRFNAVLIFMIIAYIVLRIFVRIRLGIWITRCEPLWGPYYAFMTYLAGMSLGLRGFWPYVVPSILVVSSLVWVAQLPKSKVRRGGEELKGGKKL